MNTVQSRCPSSGCAGRLWPSGSLAGVDGAVGRGRGSSAGPRLPRQPAWAAPLAAGTALRALLPTIITSSSSRWRQADALLPASSAASTRLHVPAQHALQSINQLFKDPLAGVSYTPFISLPTT